MDELRPSSSQRNRWRRCAKRILELTGGVGAEGNANKPAKGKRTPGE